MKHLPIRDEDAHLIEGLVESGRYASPEEAVAAALSLLNDQEARVLGKIDAGLDALERGELIDGPAAMEMLRKERHAKVVAADAAGA